MNKPKRQAVESKKNMSLTDDIFPIPEKVSEILKKMIERSKNYYTENISDKKAVDGGDV